MPFVDDPTIANAEILLRRIPNPAEITSDPKAKLGIRPRSSAFDPNADGSPMSVQRLLILEQLGLNPIEVMLSEFPEWGIVSFTAELIRGFGKGVASDANDEDGQAHAIIEDLTGGQKRQVAKACDWLVLPAGFNPTEEA